MLQSLALIAILAAAGWLVFVARLGLARPEAARAGLSSMASTVAIRFAALPTLTGAGLLAYAAL